MAYCLTFQCDKPFIFQSGVVHKVPYAPDYVDEEGSTSIVFAMNEEVGALAKALRIFEVRILF